LIKTKYAGDFGIIHDAKNVFKQDSNEPAYSGPGYMSNLMLSSHTEFLCSVEQALQAARINLIDMHVEASQV
jgi:hypothetical protein